MKNYLALVAILLALAGGVAAVTSLAPGPAIAACDGGSCP